MGLLDKKTRIFDVCLTNKGRELLSKNQLDFAWYAFSDDGVDYSGSLVDRSTATTNSGSCFDDFVHDNVFCFEATRREDKGINNFLFTMPIQSEVLTQFSLSNTGSMTLKRNYEVASLASIIYGAANLEKLISQEDVLDYVIVIEEETPVQTSGLQSVQGTLRDNTFVADQMLKALQGDIVAGAFSFDDLTKPVG